MIKKRLSAQAEYNKLQSAQCAEILKFLQKNGIYFSVICELKHVSFEPMLPSHIMNSFQPISFFILAGYAFDSLLLGQRGLSFEAGFGSENIGSCIQMDYNHILQIAVEDQKGRDVALWTRLNAGEIFESGKEQEDEFSRSMQAILSHPHNQKFFH